MKHYRIAELEQLSGVKAHTIRIWEKRYNLISPERTDTNIRLYNDHQVRKLLNITALLASGVKISKVALLSENDIHSRVRQIQSKSNTDVATFSYINDLTSSMLDFNEELFENALTKAISQMGLFEAMTKVFYPFLYKIGLMWTTDGTMPVQEHFASNIIQRKLIAIIDALPPCTKKNKIFMLMLPPMEWHEIGLLFSNYIIKSKGFRTIYLGQNVPYDNVAPIIKLCKVTHVLIFLVSRRNESEVRELRKHLNLSASTQLLVAGGASQTALVGKNKNSHIMTHPTDLLKFL